MIMVDSRPVDIIREMVSAPVPHVEAFRRLQEILRGVPRNKFSMTFWDCGSTQCAIGHAMHDPWFVQRGFYPHFSPTCPMLLPAFDSEKEWWAVGAFFQVSYRHAIWLFAEASYLAHKGRGPKAVINRIDVFLRAAATAERKRNGTQNHDR